MPTGFANSARTPTSQVELAQILEISQKRVSAIETGDIEKTKVDTLRRYADAVGGVLKVEVQVGDDTFQIA